MSERFIKPTPRADNIGMPISAQDINILQDIGIWTQRAIFEQGDEDFKQRVLFILEHNPLVNRAWMDLFSDATYLDTTKSTLVHNPDERTLTIPDGQLSGVYYSKIIVPEGVFRIRYVMGLINAYLPEGCTATFQISTDGQNFYPLNLSADPKPLPRYGQVIILRGSLTRDSLQKHPQIRSVAVFFQDYNTGQVNIDDKLTIIPPTNYDDPSGQRDGPGTSGSTEPGADFLDGIFDEPISRSISHWELKDVHPDQHHPKNHRHNHDGIDPVVLGEDTVGVLPVDQLPDEVVLESEFVTLLPDELIWIDELNQALEELYNRIKSEFPDDLRNAEPGWFPDFVKIKVIGDTILEYDPDTGKLIKTINPRETVHLIYFPNGALSHTVTFYASGKGIVDVLVRDKTSGRLVMTAVRELTNPPGDAALQEAAAIAQQLQG